MVLLRQVAAFAAVVVVIALAVAVADKSEEYLIAIQCKVATYIGGVQTQVVVVIAVVAVGA